MHRFLNNRRMLCGTIPQYALAACRKARMRMRMDSFIFVRAYYI